MQMNARCFIKRLSGVTPKNQRIASLDAARGLALVAMFGYHLTWDLAYFALIGPHSLHTPFFRGISHAIASSFLVISGVSLAIAAISHPFNWRAYWRRIGAIVAAACLVTGVSWRIFPDSIIFFGILHCIAVSSLVALPFLFAPWPWTLGAACLALALPWLVEAPLFDAPAIQWIGLGAIAPVTFDFRPLLPWSGMLLAGVFSVQCALAFGLWPKRVEADAGSDRGRRKIWPILCWGGRHSLLVYLVHQPVLFGLLTVYSALLAGEAAVEEHPFHTQCVTECATSAASRAQCARACACTAQTMQELNLWSRLVQNQLTETDRALLAHIAGQCARRSGDGVSMR